MLAILPNLAPVCRYQADLDDAREAVAKTSAVLNEMTAQVETYCGLLKAAPPTNEEEAHDQQIHARCLAEMEQRRADSEQQCKSALVRLNALESRLPAMTQALIAYLIRHEAEPDYRNALVEFNEAAARYRLLRETLIAWNPARTAEVEPIPGNRWTAKTQSDALYQEHRRLAGQGIRLPLRPGEPILDRPQRPEGRPKSY